ncbi:adenylate/guanylate cyclase domain-containing protein [Mariprofundus sp. EBB-1]|uniref:adenylate/guanylate cyclase domain-containing protein n=1 Tax=Mariprofundus sp. EBB-1 TaxID=2650971 RepID=UPI001F2046D9|nr:adenylate/guanylate cyclase domain-containing protein [Mariprofundus sp. EBB-1]
MSLRMLWSLLTIFLVAIVAVVMMVSISHIEKKAWHESEDQQAKLLISLLSDELKMPMVAVSNPEVDNLIKMFMQQTSGASVFLRWANGTTEKFGERIVPQEVEALSALTGEAMQIKGLDKWYAIGVQYNATHLGTIAVFFPGESWRQSDLQIKLNLTIVAAIIALLASLLVYGMSGRVVNQLRFLAMASKRVGSGDFSVQIPVYSSNEFGKSFHQFNKMVSSLEHREKVFDLYGHYQRPNLVADEYDRNTRHESYVERNVTVLALEMHNFDDYIKACNHQHLMSDLNRVFALFQQIVQAFGGHVDQIVGDRLIAVFNHPFDLKSHENQAAKAGLALIEANMRLNQSQADANKMLFTVALAIGEVIVGHLGVGRRKEFTIVGTPVALAQQLSQLSNLQGLSEDSPSVVAQYGTMLSLGHGFKQKDLGKQNLSDGTAVRCIRILAGEAYVSQEIDEVVDKALKRSEPEEIYEDEGW